MPGTEIKALRNAGKLDEALSLARKEYEASPEEPWTTNNLVWVYDSFCNKYAEEGNLSSFADSFSSLIDLDAFNASPLINDTLCWRFNKLIRNILSKQQSTDVSKLGDVLFSLVRHLNPTKPSEQYTVLYKAFHKLKDEWHNYISFCDWWGFDNFREDDFVPEKMSNGKKMSISTAEGAYIAYAKRLLLDKDRDAIETYLPKLERLHEKHPEMAYPGFYIGKLLLCLDEKNQALNRLLPFAKKKINEFWIWQLLADTQDVGSDIRLACLMRAVKCKTQESFLLNVRLLLAKELIGIHDYKSAKTQIAKIIQVREANNYSIPTEIRSWVNEKWYTDTILEKEYFNLDYMSITAKLMHSDVPIKNVVVSFVNNEKKIVNVIIGKKQIGFFNYESLFASLAIGDVLAIRSKSTPGYLKVFSAELSDNAEGMEEFRKVIECKVCYSDKKKYHYACIDSETGYIPLKLVKDNNIHVDDTIKAHFLYNLDRKKGRWGWVCVKLES